MYDVIGDIHGHYQELHQLLLNMGYRYNKKTHSFSHPQNRKAVFMGDYIDRGSDNLKVINLVRNMTAQQSAHAIMGNHEFNAVHWATRSKKNPTEFLRKHTDKNREQHASFLNETERDPQLYHDTIAWFKSLPAFIKLDNYHFVHACWHTEAIASLQKEQVITKEGLFTEDGWHASADEGTASFLLSELLLKGPEEPLPNGHSFLDKNGIERRNARIAWWRTHAKTYGEAYTSIPSSFPLLSHPITMDSSNTLSQKVRNELTKMPANAKIFVGHFWETGTPKPLSDKVCCVDYSVGKGDKLVAYRIQKGETEFNAKNFTWVNNADIIRQNTPRTAPRTLDTKLIA